MVEIVKILPNDPSVIRLIEELDEYLSSLYPSESNHLDSVGVLLRSNVYFIGAMDNNRLCGIAAVKYCTDGYGEIKRLYVSKSSRGNGIGKKLISALEKHLHDMKIKFARLETGIYQSEVIQLCESLGYKRIRPFGNYKDDKLSIFMEKRIA